MHAANIFRVCLSSHQNGGLAPSSRGLRVSGGKHDFARRSPGARGHTRPNHITVGIRVHLTVQQFIQRAGFHPQQRFLARDHPILSQSHSDANQGPRRSLNPHAIQNMDAAVFQCELDLHLFAQAYAHGFGVFDQLRKGLWCLIFQRRPAVILFKEKRLLTRLQRIPALRLRQIAAFDHRRSGHTVHELKDTRTTFPLPQPKHHRLHHEAKPRIRRRPFGHAQEPRRGAFPGPRHRTQNTAELFFRILRKGLIGLVLISIQCRVHRIGI